MLKKNTRDTLQTILAFVPLLMFMVAIAYWMVESAGHNETEHRHELEQILK